jgi:hypothetical protein
MSKLLKEYFATIDHFNTADYGYQHCGEKNMHRYLAELNFRYNNRVRLGVDDVHRTENAPRGVVGKRLTYRSPDQQTA